MFVGLTHATFGLDHVRPGGERDPAPIAARLAPVPLDHAPDAARVRRSALVGLVAASRPRR